MTENIVHRYLRLFEVRLMHHYWLDEGDKIFDFLTDTDLKENRLLLYDVRSFFSVEPTRTTNEILEGFHSVFKATGNGFVVAAPSDIQLPADAVFEFVLKVIHPDFFNYTALTLRKQKISEFYHDQLEKKFIYKEGVYVFENKNGVLKNGTRFLSSPVPGLGSGSYPVEALVSDNADLYQAIGDTANDPPDVVSWVKVAGLNQWPVFVHQKDIPPIPLQSGLPNIPTHGLLLTPEIPRDIFSLIRIEPLTAGQDLSLMSNANTFSEPVFEIHFKNRITYREEHSAKTGAVISISTKPSGMTYHGNSDTSQKPSVDFIKPILQPPDKIERVVSEIFV